MIRNRPWLVFALIFFWKISLFFFTAQPVPANDAFFYDGAVVHYLLHGGYYNPCILQAFPISATKVFSAYPPGYQAPLLGWMSVWGTSAFSAVALHITLFGLFLLVMLAIFKRLQIPGWCVNVAGGFLLIFTFHDRPDSFAQLLGALGLYACVRSRRILGRSRDSGDRSWSWLMALFIILAECSSFQIGTTYMGIVFLCTIAACHLDGEKLPGIPMAVMLLAPISLVFLVKITLPVAWEGFLSEVHQTPFLSGFRKPSAGDILKIIRTVPAILLITILLPISWFRQHQVIASNAGRREAIILVTALLAALGILASSLTVFEINTISIANYLQPVIVASYLALLVSWRATRRWLQFQIICMVPLVLLGSIRAVGMTTWGVACAMDVSYSSAVKLVDAELTNHPHGYKVVMSSAFLYGAARHDDLDFIHSDYMGPVHDKGNITDEQLLSKLKPEKIILTQFDYYRRYQSMLGRAKSDPALKQIQVIDTSHVRAPDSYPSLRQILQHVSWAPIVINLTWDNATTLTQSQPGASLAN